MTNYHSYDQEGKERVEQIAKYVLKFVDDDLGNEQYREDIHCIVVEQVKKDDYLMDEYGYEKAEQLVYNELEKRA